MPSKTQKKSAKNSKKSCRFYCIFWVFLIYISAGDESDGDKKKMISMFNLK